VSAAKPVLYGDVQRWGLVEADTLALLPRLPDACVDAVVTDPPYGIDVVGAGWDHFGGGELAGPEAFERWTSAWAAQCRRLLKPGGYLLAFGAPRTFHRLVAGIEDAGLEVRDQVIWVNGEGVPKSRRLPGGLGTALKPAYEPILIARAPLDGTVTANLAAHGTGALGIDAARVQGDRWPANVVLSHAEGCSASGCTEDCPLPLLDRQAPQVLPSRFFYAAKASRAEREAGCEELPSRTIALYTGKNRRPRVVRNIHPTVKPIELMRWLVRLACPPGGVVLDPFCGSGTTGAAALLEGRQFVGLEREAEFVDIARARITHWAEVATREAA
jgi:site-specific DNA-methyltransferase (adenine-specific)